MKTEQVVVIVRTEKFEETYRVEASWRAGKLGSRVTQKITEVMERICSDYGLDLQRDINRHKD